VNITQLFQAQSIANQRSHFVIYNRRIRLFRRPDSQHWQCRFKLDNGSWHQASTGITAFKEAETRAIAIYENVRIRVDNNLAIKTKSFRRAAEEEAEALRHARSGRLTKQTTGDYIFVIERYLIPFFGRYQFVELNQDLVDGFAN
jgi:hypothetical protein